MGLRQVTIALATAAIVGLGACGGSDGGAEVASLGGNADNDTTTTVAAKDIDPEDAALEFAKCMREHGIDLPDPQVTGDGERRGVIIGGGPGTGRDADGPNFDSDEFREANEACRPIMEEAFGEFEPPSAEEQAEMRDQMLAFAKCMREHGIDMPDPTFEDGGRVSIGIGGGADDGEAPDFDSDEFEAAQQACGDELGMEGGGPIGFSSRAAEMDDDE